MNANWKTPTSSIKGAANNRNVRCFEVEVVHNERSCCKFCHQVYKTQYRLSVHEETCTFKVPQILKDGCFKIPRIRIVPNCENLTDMLGFACVEDLYHYNSLASLCIPGIFPLVFLGQSHFGNKPPPILKKTAFNRSMDILIKLLDLHKEVTLSNHIILFDESTGIESYLGTRLLIPESPRIQVLFCDVNVTKVGFMTEREDCQEAFQRQRELDYMAQGLLFLHKMLNNALFWSIAVNFVIKQSSAIAIFWRILMHQYQHNINVQMLMYNNAAVAE